MANYLYGLLQVVRLNHHSELVRLAYLLRMLSLGEILDDLHVILKYTNQLRYLTDMILQNYLLVYTHGVM